MQIEKRNIADLIPYAGNARTHGDDQVNKLAASIKEFGFNTPILIDAQNGIIAGHGRLQAAKKLGMTEVPCVVLGHLNDAQRRAYILADNRLALDAGWDFKILKAEVDRLQLDKFEILMTGFTPAEIKKLEPPKVPALVTELPAAKNISVKLVLDNQDQVDLWAAFTQLVIQKHKADTFGKSLCEFITLQGVAVKKP